MGVELRLGQGSPGLRSLNHSLRAHDLSQEAPGPLSPGAAGCSFLKAQSHREGSRKAVPAEQIVTTSSATLQPARVSELSLTLKSTYRIRV